MVCFLLCALGADPQQNQFDGVFKDRTFIQRPIEVEGFHGKPVPGFDGLRAIANYSLEYRQEDLEKMLAFFWLCQWVASAKEDAVAETEVSSCDDIVKSIRNLRQLDLPNSEANIARLKETILATQAACRKYADGRLEDAIVCEFLTYVCQNYIRRIFHVEVVEHCLQQQP
jgi:hypothetical protein